MGTSLKGKNLLTEVSDEHVCRNSKLESNCNFNVFEYFSMNLAPGLILTNCWGVAENKERKP